jgi:PEGA domain-containing protein
LRDVEYQVGECMKQSRLNTALVIVCMLSFSAAVFAKGSGGGHGSGGHGSGGRASGGSGRTGGRASTGSAGSSAGRGAGGTSAAGASRSAPTTRTGQSSGRRTSGGTVVGTAVPRATSPFAVSPLFYSTLRFPGYAGLGWGYGGLGLLYDPLWSPYGFGYSSFGFYSGYGRSYTGGGYAADPFTAFGPTGSVRLNVEPRDADVYVDGYYAGIVDDFDGHFQHLDLVPGPHHIEISAPGYQPLVVDVTIQPHHKIEYRSALTRSLP